MTVSRPGQRRSDDRGGGLIGTLTGLLVFLLMMFGAVQVLFDLYATSLVTSAAHDAARLVAGYDQVVDRCRATELGDREFEDSLGTYVAESGASLSWTCNRPDSVRVRVVAQHPTMLPSFLAGLTGLGRVDRTIVVRSENVR